MNSTPKPRSRDPLVMIVEDEPEMLEFLERIVREAGYRTASATDGLQVLEKARELLPDLIVLDLMLPKYGGFELLHDLRRGRTAGIPLVVVTARFTGTTDRAAIGKQPNVAAFFEKPLSLELLLNAVREIAGPPKQKP